MTAVDSPGSVQKRPIYTWINEKRPNKKRQMGSATALKRWQQSVRLSVCKKDLCIPEYMKRDLLVAQRHLRDESSLVAWECTMCAKETYYTWIYEKRPVGSAAAPVTWQRSAIQCVQRSPMHTWMYEKRAIYSSICAKRPMSSATALAKWQQSVRLRVYKRDRHKPKSQTCTYTRTK